MRILQVFFYTVLSVFLMTIGIPNEIFFFGMPLAGLLSLIPFYLALSKCRSCRQAGLITSVFAGLVHITSSFWLSNFKEYAIFTIGASAAFYFLAGWFAGQILYIPFRFAKMPENSLREDSSPSTSGPIGRILFFTCFWTLLEWLKSNGFLAYPWGTLILTAWKWKLLIQIVSLTGTWGISFLFSLFAATAAEIILHGKPVFRSHSCISGTPAISQQGYAVIFTLSLFTVSLIYGTFEYTKPRIPEKTLNAVLVQHNGDSWQDSEEQCISTAQQLTSQAMENSDLTPELVVWSEGILTYTLPDSFWYYEMIPRDLSLRDSIIQTGIPHIIGSPFTMNETGTEFGNCAVLFDGEGNISDHYAKIHLVPFAEGIPFADQYWMQKLMQLLAGFSHGWKAGEEFKTFTVQGSEPICISTPVCFEDAFPSVCRKLYLAGSEVFVNITNDSWSLMKSSEYQHYVISSYRAIECRTTLVRATNGGYTTVTDPAGRILTDLPLFEEASILTQIPVYEREITPYAIVGDWLPVMCILILMLFFIQYIYFLYNTKYLYITMTDE